MAEELEWYKCKDVGWCDLFKVDIDHEFIKESEGIFICWTGTTIDDSLTTIVVGQGYIYDLIIDLREDQAMEAFKHKGVFVTWSRVSSYKMNGIELFLREKLKPLFKGESISGWKKEVNIPWDQDEMEGFEDQLPDEEMESGDKEAKLPWQ
ncbi:hypothetical protein OAQ99_04175 [Candidatus Kapabacteria bacterium]|nr:hypothetical protein [Candidatus Kapabacteria bacterium]